MEPFNTEHFTVNLRYAEDEWLNEFQTANAREIHEAYNRIVKAQVRAHEYGFLRSLHTDEELDLYDLFAGILDSSISEDNINVDKLDSEKINDFLHQFEIDNMS